MRTGMRHPDQGKLALLAGGDLAWPDALSTRWHVRGCPACKQQLDELRADRIELGAVAAADCDRSNASLPANVRGAWTALEAEMRANIRLGLTAGSLASRDAEPVRTESLSVTHLPLLTWRWVAVCSALLFVLTTGWWLRSSSGSQLPVTSAAAGEQSEPGPDAQNAAIQLMVPVAHVSRTETDFAGSTRSRVFDGETGQVTLQQVYVQ